MGDDVCGIEWAIAVVIGSAPSGGRAELISDHYNDSYAYMYTPCDV